ncbi:MAG TPA: hypothetical protein PLX77_06330, partial [Candidatus Cloacimonadota bacterium]|nr:hypothetical protein [Candidatus Cloacimonadota bacterium]
MKKLLTFFVSLIFGVALALPEDGLYDLSDNRATERELSKGHLEVPQFSFVHGPDTLMTTYYDYMIGGYNNSALATIPESHGGGYFCTFHARPTRYGIRSVYWAYINCNGVLEQSGMFPGENIAGYPALALDQEGANPLYVWHTNGDTDDDLEVMFAYDRMLNGVPGNLTEPVILIDNPVEIGSTTDNEFIWPEICIGPSPNPSMRRLYIAAKNITRHGDQPSENVLIKYADFDSQMLQNGSELVWSSSSIPVLDAWNQDLVINRRPFLSMSADNLGNLYYIGYHYAMDIDSEVIPEADMDVFVCPNYGEGEWTHHSFDSTLDCWIPVYDDPIWRDGDENDDEEWMWKIANSGHFNSMVDNNGRVRALGLWPLFIPNSYQLNLHTVKCYSFNPQDISMQIKEVYPKGNPENVAYPHFIPWDVQPPWGEVDEWALSGDEYYPVLQQTIFPFPYWDETAITDAMIFHYNHLMLTNVNSENMMVALWQDSQRARHAWLEPDVYPEDLAYQNSPEIVIATSADGG